MDSGLIFVCAGTGIAGGVICLAEEVVDAGVVEIGQGDEDGRGDIALAGLVFGVTGLGHVQDFGDLCLIQVPVFPQVAESCADHVHHPDAV